MVGNRNFNIILAAALLVGAVACTRPSSETLPTQIGSQTSTTLTDSQINGTAISSDSDVAGLISDSKTGKGIEGVAVTDGYSVVTTDANGVYQMKRNSKCRRVYYTTPADYKISLDKENHMPAFYSEETLNSAKKYRIDFVLDPLDAPETNFSLVMIGDPQCYLVTESGRYTKETIGDIKSFVTEDRYPNAYAVTLGDVTFDATNMFSRMKKTMSNISIGNRYLPFFQCIGNHDHNSLAADSNDSEVDDYNATGVFVETFGPTDYSFDRGSAHIVVMDDVMVYSLSSSSKPNGATWNYYGGFSDAQMEWLRQDIAAVKNPEDKLFILCMHIPVRGGGTNSGASFNTTRHYADLMSLSTQFYETHFMIGHTHYPQNYIHSKTTKNGQRIYEHIHQAACGAWWSCNSSVSGGPNGYNVYTVTGNTITDWINKGSGRDETYQMRIYDGDQLFTGSKNYDYYWYSTSNKYAGIPAIGRTEFKNAFVAEIWDDDDTNWKVALYQNGSKVGDFVRIPNGGCCNVAIAAYYFNELGKNTTTWTSTTASHYWYCAAPSGKPSGESNWEVRATQIIPSSRIQKTYTVNRFTTDYSEF